MKSYYSLDVYNNDDENGILGEDFSSYVRIDYIIVDKEERGQGKGRELLKAAIAEAKTHKLPIFIIAEEIEDDTDLDRLVALYESEGFSIHSPAGDGVLLQL